MWVVLGFVFGCYVAGKRFIYYISCHKIWLLSCENEMKNPQNKDEIRWQVVKAMLDEFPTLRQKVKNYVKA